VPHIITGNDQKTAPCHDIEPSVKLAIGIEREGERIIVSNQGNKQHRKKRRLGSMAPAEKIGADQYGKVKEIEKGPLVRDKKEDSPRDGDQEKNDEKFLVKIKVFCQVLLKPHVLLILLSGYPYIFHVLINARINRMLSNLTEKSYFRQGLSEED